jgi:prepilin-type N-terminal cleavage/methylation domain-containing protein
MLQAITSRRRGGFTLIELMLVVAIIALLATIAIPNYLRARKRSQAARMLDDLKAVDYAMELYAAEYHKKGNEPIGDADVAFLKKYIKERVMLYESLPNDFFGNPIVMVDLKTPPRLSTATFDALSDVAPAAYWFPYEPTP